MKTTSFKVLIPVLALLPLGGCFIDDTINETKKVNAHLEQTNHSQTLGGSILIMINRDYPTNIRVGATKTVFIEAADEKLGAYLGTPVPIEKRDVPAKVDGIPVSLANVAYVRDSRVEGINVAPINTDLHGIQRLAVLDLLNTLSLALKAPGLSTYDSDRIQRITKRMVPVTMAVLGAVNLDSVMNWAHDRGELELVVPEQDREDAVTLLMELVEFSNYNEDQLRDLRALIETRLQVNAF